MAEAADREFARAEEKQRREALSAVVLQSPAMQQDLLNMAFETAVKHPLRVSKVIAAHRPQTMIRALSESEKGRKALAAAGFRLNAPEA
jgi:hypothetical protein